VNVCSFSYDILGEMRKKERDEISLFFSSLSCTREREENKFNQWFAMLAIVYMASSTFLWCQWRLGLLEWVEVIFIPMRNNEKRWSLTTYYQDKQKRKREKKRKVKRLYLYNRFHQYGLWIDLHIKIKIIHFYWTNKNFLLYSLLKNKNFSKKVQQY